MKAHDVIILNVNNDKYLGDIVSLDGSNAKNIKSRIGKFEMGLFLRQSIFLSSVLLNSETWVNLTKTDIEDLEALDESLLRWILDCPSKTPIPGLYLELDVYPIKYQLKEK